MLRLSEGGYRKKPVNIRLIPNIVLIWIHTLGAGMNWKINSFCGDRKLL